MIQIYKEGDRVETSNPPGHRRGTVVRVEEDKWGYVWCVVDLDGDAEKSFPMAKGVRYSQAMLKPEGTHAFQKSIRSGD